MSEPMGSTADLLHARIADGRAVLAGLAALAEPVERAAALLADALLAGRQLLCCGNGGSAADCAHFTAEIAGRFLRERRGYPAIDLTANHALLTALSNDYPAADVFARQVAAFGRADDVLAVFSTSGNSENVVRALETGRAGGLATMAFLGQGGGRCRGLADIELIVASEATARVQEAHLLLYHTICEAIDGRLA
ncbi:MAG: SIS domain-containing protein [Phycisphaeraceae bacterium]